MPVEAAGSEQFLLAKEGFIRVAAEADANKVRGEERKRGQTRGTCSPAEARGFSGTLHSRAHLHRQPLLPMFGFARAAGPNHWPKERSARNFFSPHRFLRVIHFIPYSPLFAIHRFYLSDGFCG